ncbi:prominin-2 isoform X1 [Salmo salar]|uniref:Prominin-1-A-like n=2 Tax=Salmo salar TaxID=8030 RepID=A0A1S3RRW5_SALSA|nr:prominin-1-A isoform X1 [Salmo salar]XP_014054479.1 prominin-1-A isoform X1 [Salmo salar]XP_014054485.1 prominin-1-A isoform X1 [Salmo salar]|eukprot:XP_014054469.1 PREDICTED: prominin-1-A-like [Salmo salar]
MGACRSVWRLGGCARLVSAWIGALLLGSSLALPPPATCPKGVSPMNLIQTQYQSIPRADAGFMSGVVQSFLHTVQPNPFPKDLLVKFVEKRGNIYDDKKTIKEVLLYEVGFLVCAAIGIVYIILMPLVGFCLACCRCCGYCGGHMYQEQTKAVHCHRRGLYWATLLTTLVILAGNICMFFTNQLLKVSVEDSSVELSNRLGNLQTYLTAVPHQIDSVLIESNKTVDEVTRSLNDIGPLLGREIQRSLEGPLNPALKSVSDIAKVVNRTSVLLVGLNSTLTQLQSDVTVVQANVSSVRDSINSTLRYPDCNGCSAYQSELERLTFDTTITIPSLNELQSAVDDVTKANLNSKVKEGEYLFASIPQRVTNDTRDMVQNVKQQLEVIKRQISLVKGYIPVSALSKISDTLGEAQRYIDMYSPQAEWVEMIRWGVGIILSCVVLLVVVCNLLGLFLGLVGLSPQDDPTERSGTANCAGTFLMAGAGLSFLFSWLFMLVVLILFLLGGNVYTLVCQPWRSGQLLQFVDTPGLIPGFNLREILGLKSNLPLIEVYNECEQNRPLWTTFHLYELIDLNDLLNVSKYKEEIQQQFDSNEIKLPTITLLTPEIRKQLHSFSDMVHDADISSVTQQIKIISSINLTEIAGMLDQLATVQNNTGIQKRLTQEAEDLRGIQSGIVTTIIPQLTQLNSNIYALSVVASEINGTVGDVLNKVGTAQDFLNTNTTQIVKAASRGFLDCQMGYFTKYADWANLTITQQIGRCGPVAEAVDSAEVVVCSNMVESLNAFWFSLGWCMIFLVPSIIFSIKLAKFYRRMKHSDVYENHIAMNILPQAQVKPY